MSDQNLPDLNESNQMMNAQPETASDQIAPNDEKINGNLFVTGNVAVGPFAITTKQGQIEVTGPVAEFGFARRDLTSWPAQPAAGNRFVWYNPQGTARLYTDVKGDLLTVTANGDVGIGTNPSLNQAQLHVQGKVIYSGGSRGGLSFGNRETSGFVESPTNGERWAWYSSGGTARLWSGGDKLSVNANGNVGIGTTNPEAKLHLVDSIRGSIKLLRTSGVGDDFSYDGGDDTSFWFTHYGQESGETRFLWNDGTRKTDLLTIKNKGNVGIGTPNPQSMLHIGDGLGSGYRSWMVRGTQVSGETDNVFFGLKREGGDRQDAVIAWGDNPEDAFRFIFVGYGGPADGQEIMRLQANGNVGDVRVTGDVYAQGQKISSSRELKENIAELSGSEAVEALKNLNPVKFNFKADSDKNRHIGFIAEDVPELVATSDRKTLSPMDIVAVLTQALKEQQNTISALVEKVKLLEAKTA